MKKFDGTIHLVIFCFPGISFGLGESSYIDVGDRLCWRRFMLETFYVGDNFDISVTEHEKIQVTNIKILLPRS